MELLTPSFGLIFWMMVWFGIMFFLLKKFAWPIILGSLNEREKSISDALDSAKKAKEEMLLLKSDNEKILAEARNERDQLLKDARDTKDAMIHEAKTKAQQEAERLLKQAREAITTEKNAAINEIKDQVATLSVQIAERILKQELSSADKQKALVNQMLNEANISKN
jgi:F-type H+-transporting ATPase subunit b